MTSLELFERLGLALAIGLLIGIERGWREREAEEGARAAGIRTYALIGLLGGVWAALGQVFGAVVLGFAAAAFALCFALFQWLEARAAKTSSATGMVAGLLTFALGALAVMGATAQAAAGAVAATLLLAERGTLHAFVDRLKWSELRAALILLAMTVILLPLLPDRTIDPWNALNPYELWAMTAAIAALSYAGYVCVRLFGERRGLLLGALAAALVSSTAVTLNYSRLPRPDAASRAAISAGIAAAWGMSLLRMAVIAIFIAPAIAPALLPPIVTAVLILGLAAGFWYLRSDGAQQNGEHILGEPFDLGLVLRFGALLALVVFVYKFAVGQFGESGLFVLAAISGTADVDPITLAVARSAGAQIAFGEAAMLILLAASANFTVRAFILLSVRDLRFAAPLVGCGVLALGSGWAVMAAAGF